MKPLRFGGLFIIIDNTTLNNPNLWQDLAYYMH
jgi:hypothetical protein